MEYRRIPKGMYYSSFYPSGEIILHMDRCGYLVGLRLFSVRIRPQKKLAQMVFALGKRHQEKAEFYLLWLERHLRRLGVTVLRGQVLDGSEEYLKLHGYTIRKVPGQRSRFRKVLA